jgi:hypothetical protein
MYQLSPLRQEIQHDSNASTCVCDLVCLWFVPFSVRYVRFVRCVPFGVLCVCSIHRKEKFF